MLRRGVHYYDYKLHAVCEMQGMIHSYDMVAASIYNFHYFKDVQ